MDSEKLSQILMPLVGRELLFMHFLVLVNSIGCFLSPPCFQRAPKSEDDFEERAVSYFCFFI